MTEAPSRSTAYSYDALSRLATAKDPLLTTTYSYDVWSNVTQVQKPDGTTNRFVYDAVNRLTGIGGPVTASYSRRGEDIRACRRAGQYSVAHGRHRRNRRHSAV